ncbi:MAG: helix-turn-helix transcriptional regulator [Clostridia bacterium]|nr:helix-turn-helix transcriptional regulator [Clostridia bacterium]
MLFNRIKQFREYNDLEPFYLAEVLGISIEQYNNFETGKEVPTIDMVHALARCYKVTVDEFYGYSPRLILHNKNDMFEDDDPVSDSLLRMSDLSWDEKKLILQYRSAENKEELLKLLLQQEENNK